jgi:hypothetical protein
MSQKEKIYKNGKNGKKPENIVKSPILNFILNPLLLYYI